MRLPRLIAVLGAVAVLLLPAYLKAYTLSGGSDAPTLLLGDKAVVNQAAYWINVPYTQTRLIRNSHPKRGDLVLVQRPDSPAKAFKRVIGLPGEVVEMRDNRVIVDGSALPLTALRADFSWVPSTHRMASTVYNEDGHWVAFSTTGVYKRDLAPLRLKGGEYFLLGDNRDVSLDCRVWGPLKEGAIYGKVILTLPTGPRH
jgi:signal peptidase I